MNRVVCQVFAAGLLLAGCQSSPFQTAEKRSLKQSPEGDRGDKATSPWLDFGLSRDRNAAAVADNRDPRLGGGRKRTESDLNMAHAALSEGRIEEAKSLYRLVLRDDPRNASAHHRLGTIADRQQDFRAAARHYSEALRQRPNDAALLSDIGWSSFLQKRYAESEQYLTQAVTLDPKNSKALYNLGWLYGVQQKPELAYRLFLRAGSRRDAQKLMARLEQTMSAEPSGMLADGSSSSRRRTDLRAPDPNAARRNASDERYGPGTRNINVTLREQMDRARDRDLALRNRDPRGYGADSPGRMRPLPGRADDRSPDARTMPGDFLPGDGNRRFAPDRATPSPQDSRIATRPPSNRDLNDAMRRIDGYSDPQRPLSRRNSSDAGVRNTGYAAPGNSESRHGDVGRGRPGDWQHPESAGRDGLWPPSDAGFSDDRDRRPSAPRGAVRDADSQREIPNGTLRRQSPPAVDPVHREALRLGHNTGTGGVPFPIPDHGARSERTPGVPDRGRRSPDVRRPRTDAPPLTHPARRPVTPTPWRGGERDAATGDGYSRNADAGRDSSPGYGSGIDRDFGGPDIRPRSKDPSAVSGPDNYRETGPGSSDDPGRR